MVLTNGLITHCKLLFFLSGDGFDIISVGEVFDNDLLHSWFYHDIPTGGKIWLGMTFNAVSSNFIS